MGTRPRRRTPVLGLALIEVGAARVLIRAVRRAVIAAQAEDGGWPAYWWTTGVYATAHSLEFLALTGGVPQRRCWNGTVGGGTPFERAHALRTAVVLGLGDAPIGHELAVGLLDT